MKSKLIGADFSRQPTTDEPLEVSQQVDRLITEVRACVGMGLHPGILALETTGFPTPALCNESSLYSFMGSFLLYLLQAQSHCNLCQLYVGWNPYW